MNPDTNEEMHPKKKRGRKATPKIKNTLKENDAVRCTLDEREMLINIALKLNINVYEKTALNKRNVYYMNLAVIKNNQIMGSSSIFMESKYTVYTPLQFVAKMLGIDNSIDIKIAALESQIKRLQEEINDLKLNKN